MQSIEKIIAEDPGARGVCHLAQYGSLLAACEGTKHARKVAIVTGFFLPRLKACETDGPPGAMMLARAYRRLGASVEFVTSQACFPFIHDLGVTTRLASDATDHYDAVIAIEAVGRAADGCAYTSRRDNITELAGDLDAWVEYQHSQGAFVVGIGDGGNEIGMGKISDALSTTNLAPIACRVACDSLLVCGVSNWGGYALAGVLCGHAVLDPEQACCDLERTMESGCLNAIGDGAALAVDGFDWPVHEDILLRIRECLL